MFYNIEIISIIHASAVIQKDPHLENFINPGSESRYRTRCYIGRRGYMSGVFTIVQTQFPTSARTEQRRSIRRKYAAYP
jgi:hypothetical protein